MYLITVEKYIYVYNTEICKREVLELESLSPEYLERRLKYYRMSGYRLGGIWKVENLDGAKWSLANRVINKYLGV